MLWNNEVENEIREKIAKEFENSGRQFWGNSDVAAEIRRNKWSVPTTSTAYGSYPKPTTEGPCT